MTRSLVLIGFALALLAAPHAARANGDPVPTAAPPAATHFERFVRSACLPCVQESYPVKAVAIAPLQLPVTVLGLRSGTEMPPRPGQIGFEVLRASELGRATRQLLAVRVALSVGMGTGAANQTFPLGFGMLDADDAADFAYGLNEIAKAAAAPLRAGPENVDIDYRVGSLRVGLLRSQSEGVAYVQVGDIAMLAVRPVWQVPTTVFLSPSELPALATAMNEVLARIRTLRGS